MFQSVETKKVKNSSTTYVNKSHKRILKSKENLFKPKCSKQLQRKLKKYKLRRDGNEDPDVLNVSQILIKSLKIKSPTGENKLHHNNNIVDGTELTFPNNYLFKMVKKRRACAQLESLTNTNNNGTIIDDAIEDIEDASIVVVDEDLQDKKQTDAFKLMMNSRNKSIGGNSPGKEKCNVFDSQEIIEKKEIKAKRLLQLQKMAQDKGALKKKEIEEFRDMCVEKKMIKRAKKFKEMITKSDTKKNENVENKSKIDLNNTPDTCPTKQSNASEPNNTVHKNHTLKLCDLFSNSSSVLENKTVKNVPDEDLEFFKKLSPSLKKKENMLCYFKKMNKDEILNSDQSESNSVDDDKAVIKVKFTPKRKKKKSQHAKDQLDCVSSETLDIDICIPNDHSDKYKESRKRKRQLKPEDKDLPVTKMNNFSDSTNGRPKRSVTKPAKYTEAEQFISSDEDLHIFTPKKKKNLEKTSQLLYTDIHEAVKQDAHENISNKSRGKNKKTEVKKQTVNLKNESIKLKKATSYKTYTGHDIKTTNDEAKPVKLAPIFVSKSKVSQEVTESKVIASKCDIAEKSRRTVVNHTTELSSLEIFKTVVHIQQLTTTKHLHESNKDWYCFYGNQNDVDSKIGSNFMIKQLLAPYTTIPIGNDINLPLLKQKADQILKSIKSSYPKFPVYRTYHLLKSKSKGEFKDYNYPDLDNSVEIINSCTDESNDTPEKLSWCDKYKPTTSKQIIGNFESVKELKRWLESWTEKLIKAKSNGSDFSDMSDFYCSDADSRDATRNTNNVLILTGQTGSGKTCSVYATAAELAIKVIEVNASSKRNGKIMLQDLQEATRSHKVNRGKSSECSQKSQEVVILDITKKRGRPKKVKDVAKVKKPLTPIESLTPENSSQESVRTDMSLILIDDADIVFDQDDGFCSAVSQLIHSSKRPVILVTSSLSCLHLQKFIHIGKIIHMRPFLPRMLGTWLDIMCLADAGLSYVGLGAKLLDFNKGDIRKTINYLQFIMNSTKVNNMEDITVSQIKSHFEDESSNLSWVDSESMEGPSNVLQSQIEKKLQSYLSDSLDVFNVWWSLSDGFDNRGSSSNSSYKNKKGSCEITKIAEVLDTISFIDRLDCEKPCQRYNITNEPWFTCENASLLEAENFDYYDNLSFVNKEISKELLASTVSGAQNLLTSENNFNFLSPSMNVRRERDKIVSRHNTLSSYLNPWVVLDRRAVALDYWSSCRTICRLEKDKPDSQSRRKHRFCHYLKSLNILCKSDFFDNLAESFT